MHIHWPNYVVNFCMWKTFRFFNVCRKYVYVLHVGQTQRCVNDLKRNWNYKLIKTQTLTYGTSFSELNVNILHSLGFTPDKYALTWNKTLIYILVCFKHSIEKVLLRMCRPWRKSRLIPILSTRPSDPKIFS